MNTHERLWKDEPTGTSSDRTFGLVLALFFGLLALSPLWHHEPIRIWALVVAGVFVLPAWLRPALLAPLNRVWTRLGALLHQITNPIVLGVLFYVVFTPFGVLGRLLGRDTLGLKFETGAPTYWRPRNPPGPPPGTMARQF